MNWIVVLLVAVVLVALFWMKRAGQISVQEAQLLLRDGAMVVDVRTAGEFVSGHLPKAVNLPLNELETDVPRFVRHKGQVLLLHCHSGMRSGIALKRLKALGYHNVYNLGSYQRAASIVNGR